MQARSELSHRTSRSKRSVSTWIAGRLRLPGAPTTSEEADSHARLQAHRETLERRPAFRQVVLDIQDDIYRTVDAAAVICPDGLILELGAGVVALSAMYPDVVSSDLQWSDDLQAVLSAYAIPLASGSLRAVVAQNVFHHLPDYRRALDEMARVVMPGGVIVLVEPHHGWMARRIFPALFAFEGYDMHASSNAPPSDGLPNQALSYVVFVREGVALQADFPGMEVVSTAPLRSGIRYLATGGLNFRQIMPSSGLRLLRRLERSSFGTHLESNLAMHWMIVLRVTSHPGRSEQLD